MNIQIFTISQIIDFGVVLQLIFSLVFLVSGLPKRVSKRPWIIATPSNDGLILIFDEYIFEYVCKFKADCEWEEKMEGFEVDRLDHVAIVLPFDFECES